MAREIERERERERERDTHTHTHRHTDRHTEVEFREIKERASSERSDIKQVFTSSTQSVALELSLLYNTKALLGLSTTSDKHNPRCAMESRSGGMVTARNVLDPITVHDVWSPASARCTLFAVGAVVGALDEVGAVRRVRVHTVTVVAAEVVHVYRQIRPSSSVLLAC